MILSLNWLKSLVEIDDVLPEEIVKRLTLSTAEVEGLTKKGDELDEVVVAKIESCEKIEGTHLNLLAVNDGSGELLQVATGAPNVYTGMKTFFVRVGGCVGGKKIKKARLAGVDSYGMCCSEAELGIGSDDDGIVDLTFTDYEVGANIKSILPIEDYLIEIDNKSLTNRPDLWSHLGFARELSAIFNRKLKNIELVNLDAFDGLPKVPIKIQSLDCYRYSGLIVENVNVKRSPYEIKIRLNYCGMRDINLLADLTNYVMLELGTPMHAFDSHKVDGIIVREAFDDEHLLTLEGEEHIVNNGSLLICDKNNNPVAIAGIKGGLLASISDDTTGFLLESAVFSAVKIRKASKSIGLCTDASLRYEKSLDPEMTPKAISRLVALLKNIDKNIIIASQVTDVINYERKTLEINMDCDFIRTRIGANIPNDFIYDTLTKLGFVINNISGNKACVVVPSYRATKDVSIKEDLVEEVARMYGYDNIVPLSMQSNLVPVDVDPVHLAEYEIKKILAQKFDYNEVHSYIWSYADYNNSIGISSPSYVNLLDSSQSGQSGIRSELAPTLIMMADNNKANFKEFGIFEIGRCVTGLNADKSSIEEKHLCVAIASDKKSEKDLFFELKKVLLTLADYPAKTTISLKKECVKNYLHNGVSCAIYCGEQKIGEMGALHLAVNSKIDKKLKIAVLELDVNKFVKMDNELKTYKKVSKYQSVDIDFNFIIPNSVNYAMIETYFKEFRCKFDVEYKLIDIYQNKEMFNNARSMTFGFSICSKDHTLTANEIDNFTRRFVDHMKQKGIVLR